MEFKHQEGTQDGAHLAYQVCMKGEAVMYESHSSGGHIIAYVIDSNFWFIFKAFLLLYV